MKNYAEQFPIQRMCRVLVVSSSGYYSWRGRLPGKRAVANELLEVEVREIFKKSRETYGSPRICRELRAEGSHCGENRIAMLMRKAGIQGRPPRRFVVTTDSNHNLPVAANLLNRQFEVAAPNRVWSSDITYIRTAQGWLYLAVVIDLFSRRIVGWALNSSLHTEIVANALKMGLTSRRGEDLQGLLFHSDRGSQYASEEFRQLATNHGITLSMSRRGNCWDNAPSESFFSTLKVELIYRNDYHTTEQARLDIFNYIEVFYNRRRRHSTLDYTSPLDYERQHQQNEQMQPMLNAA